MSGDILKLKEENESLRTENMQINSKDKLDGPESRTLKIEIQNLQAGLEQRNREN